MGEHPLQWSGLGTVVAEVKCALSLIPYPLSLALYPFFKWHDFYFLSVL